MNLTELFIGEVFYKVSVIYMNIYEKENESYQLQDQEIKSVNHVENISDEDVKMINQTFIAEITLESNPEVNSNPFKSCCVSCSVIL